MKNGNCYLRGLAILLLVICVTGTPPSGAVTIDTTTLVRAYVIIAGVYEISSNSITIGGLIASTTLSARFMTTVIAFSAMVVRYKSVQNTLRYLEKIILIPSESEVLTNSFSDIKGNISFEDVLFFYPGAKHPILDYCSFKIKTNDKIAIIGKTGTGKSTITRIIMGLDFVNSGKVLIDEYDISYLNIADLRANIGFMPQNSQFFKGTIRSNIVLNNTEVSDENYTKACDMAGVSIITELSNQGDGMPVSEGGSNLSGGQKQIIAFARAILYNPKILMMDEPTNGMDTSLEHKFITNVKNYVKDKTFILITHKPSQLDLVEKVIVLDKGKVVASDTKENIIKLLSKKA